MEEVPAVDVIDLAIAIVVQTIAWDLAGVRP